MVSISVQADSIPAPAVYIASMPAQAVYIFLQEVFL
jgi:hypothetical protein